MRSFLVRRRLKAIRLRIGESRLKSAQSITNRQQVIVSEHPLGCFHLYVAGGFKACPVLYREPQKATVGPHPKSLSLVRPARPSAVTRLGSPRSPLRGFNPAPPGERGRNHSAAARARPRPLRQGEGLTDPLAACLPSPSEAVGTKRPDVGGGSRRPRRAGGEG